MAFMWANVVINVKRFFRFGIGIGLLPLLIFFFFLPKNYTIVSNGIWCWVMRVKLSAAGLLFNYGQHAGIWPTESKATGICLLLKLNGSSAEGLVNISFHFIWFPLIKSAPVGSENHRAELKRLRGVCAICFICVAQSLSRAAKTNLFPTLTRTWWDSVLICDFPLVLPIRPFDFTIAKQFARKKNQTLTECSQLAIN